MSAEAKDPAGAESLDEHGARLLGVVNLLAEMALQMLRRGETDAARGFVDSLEALQVKTKGNVSPLEEQVFESVLTQLHVAVIKGPTPPEEKPPDGAERGEDEERKPGETPSGGEG